MANKIWNYGVDPITGLERKLVLNTFLFQEDNDVRTSPPKITVFLRERTYSNGAIVSDKSADYDVVKGQISYDIDGQPLPKRDLEGNIVYKEDGVTPEERDNAYENIIYYVDNKVFSPYDLIDAGVVERFKLV